MRVKRRWRGGDGYEESARRMECGVEVERNRKEAVSATEAAGIAEPRHHCLPWRRSHSRDRIILWPVGTCRLVKYHGEVDACHLPRLSRSMASNQADELPNIQQYASDVHGSLQHTPRPRQSDLDAFEARLDQTVQELRERVREQQRALEEVRPSCSRLCDC